MEITIAIALMAVVGYVAMAFIVPTARSFSRTTTRADLQQQALVVFSRAGGDIARSAASAIAFHNSSGPTDPMTLAVVGLKDVDNAGKQSWNREIVQYCWYPSTHRVLRRVWRPGDTPLLSVSLDANNPTRLPTMDMDALAQPASLPGDEILAFDVTQADVTSDVAPPNLSMPIRLRLRLEKWSSQGAAAESFELTRAFAARNTAQWPVKVPTTPVP